MVNGDSSERTSNEYASTLRGQVERLRRERNVARAEVKRLTRERDHWKAEAIKWEGLERRHHSAHETFGVWQPIETAPKSKSDAGRDRHYVLVVYPGYKGDEPDPFVLMAYQDSLGWDTGVWRLHAAPTHWMPLPSLPGTAPTVVDSERSE